MGVFSHGSEVGYAFIFNDDDLIEHMTLSFTSEEGGNYESVWDGAECSGILSGTFLLEEGDEEPDEGLHFRSQARKGSTTKS